MASVNVGSGFISVSLTSRESQGCRVILLTGYPFNNPGLPRTVAAHSALALPVSGAGRVGELSSGVAHEMRNPLQFIANFTGASRELACELLEMLERPGDIDRQGAEELVRDIAGNLDRVERHSGRLKSISSAMMVYDRGTGGGSGRWT